jgi:hypothetical protein
MVVISEGGDTMTSERWATPLKRRIGNAAVFLVVGGIVVGAGWLISIGFYALGLWPVGALLRVGVWVFALWCLYMVSRHLLIGEWEMTRKDLEKFKKSHPDS